MPSPREPSGPNAASSATPRRLRAVLLAVVAGGLAWDAWFVFRASFEINGRRYFTLFDDASISLAYARRLIEGWGLNWAREGNPVEGFTHPAWVALMTPAHLLGLPLRLRSLEVIVLSAGLLAGAAVLAFRLVNRHFQDGDGADALPAAAATAFCYSLAYWALAGMESALQAVLVLLCVTWALDITERGEDRSVALWLALAFAYLLRMDMALVAFVVWAFVFWRRGTAIAARPRFWVGAAAFAAAALGYELFRWLYFGDLLPNTYYLKMTGVPALVRCARGLSTIALFSRDNGPLLACACAAAWVAWRRFGKRVVLVVALLLTIALYDIWVGGDAFEGVTPTNRFLCFGLPLLFVLLAAGAAALWSSLGLRPSLRRALLASLALILLSNGLAGPEGEDRWQALAAAAQPGYSLRNQILLRRLHRLESIMAPEARIATSYAGLPALFSSYRLIDVLGYNDREVARRSSTVILTLAQSDAFVPGHTKWDYEAVFRRHPDAFFTTYGIDAIEHPWMAQHGYLAWQGLWLRTDSLYLRSPLAAPPKIHRAQP